MEIYLIRHTTPDIEKGICYGQTDLDLVVHYAQEFENVKSKISNNKHFIVYSSPLKRCSLLAKQFNNDVMFDARLKELNFGDWEMKSWNDIPEEDMNTWMKDFVNVSVPNGESYAELTSRVIDFFETFNNLDTNKTFIVVSHAGPIRALLSTILKIPLKESFKIKINYGDVFQLKKTKDSFKLITGITL